MQIDETMSIAGEYIRIRYIRSRGPGGQNVNKVNTRAQLSFDLKGCPEISAAAKKRLVILSGRRLNKQGTIIIESDRFREQNRNRQECLNRLRQLIRKSLIAPKIRRKTKPTTASKHKRLSDKKHRGNTKSLRGKVAMEE